MSQKRDLTGKRFGRLTAIRPTDKRDSNGSVLWVCRCDCGNELEVTQAHLMHGNYKSCGCLKREVQLNIQKKLHMVDGTCLEWLEKRKHRKDNTSGCRGVYQMKNGKYRADIGFKSRRFYLGTFKTYEDAVQARMKAESKVHQGFVEAYYNWKENAHKDPAWAKEHPFVFEVEKRDGEIIVTIGRKGAESENSYNPD